MVTVVNGDVECYELGCIVRLVSEEVRSNVSKLNSTLPKL
jgi:hypothetical protein